MSILEMKQVVHQQIDSIEDANVLKQVNELLAKLSTKESAPISMETIFNEAVQQYGDVLKKLA